MSELAFFISIIILCFFVFSVIANVLLFLQNTLWKQVAQKHTEFMEDVLELEESYEELSVRHKEILEYFGASIDRTSLLIGQLEEVRKEKNFLLHVLEDHHIILARSDEVL